MRLAVGVPCIPLLFVLAGCGTASPAPPDVPDATSPTDPGSPPDAAFEAGGDAFLPPALPRLAAKGTVIATPDGSPVLLRGLNLGAWIFGETWMSQIDFSLTARLRQLAAEAAIGPDVDALLVARNCPQYAQDAGWLAAFGDDLAARAGRPAADALLARLAGFPSVHDDADAPLRSLLERRFGMAARDDLIDTFLDAWIGEADIAWIAAQGFNLVRVPMGYRALVTESDLEEPKTLTWNERTFARIDALLDACRDNGIYAILDIQEAPGDQRTAELYAQPDRLDLTVKLWKELSRRYRDRTEVAAYSLLAEPIGCQEMPDPVRARDDAFDAILKAIRGQGDDTLAILHDGFLTPVTFPAPAERGWTNVVYSTHLFQWDAKSVEDIRQTIESYDFLWKGAQATQGVPYLVGSFSALRDEPWAYEAVTAYTDWFNASGWGWALWSYKKIDDPASKALCGRTSSYGLRGRLASDFTQPDAWRDDLDTLRARLAAYGSLALDPNPELLSRLSAAARAPVAVPSAGGAR